MNSAIPCPHCGRLYDASHRIAGDQVWCPGCNGLFTVRFRARLAGQCEECGEHKPLNPIYASHSADVQQRLCDECRDKRQQALEEMWRGE